MSVANLGRGGGREEGGSEKSIEMLLCLQGMQYIVFRCRPHACLLQACISRELYVQDDETVIDDD